MAAAADNQFVAGLATHGGASGELEAFRARYPDKSIPIEILAKEFGRAPAALRAWAFRIGIRRGKKKMPVRLCPACGQEKKHSDFRRMTRRRADRCLICEASGRRVTEHPAISAKAMAAKKRWNVRNREKYLAHKAVEVALLKGKLCRRACERCGSCELVHAHHDDYSRPLDVTWLCPIHHGERHRELRAVLREERPAASLAGAEL